MKGTRGAAALTALGLGLGLSLSLGLGPVPAQAAEQRRLVAPADTDARLAADQPPHLLRWDPAVAVADAPLLVWLPGTGGQPATGPQRFFDTALAQGYRVLGLAYRTQPAVSQVCIGARVRAQPDCAARMRQHRVWGDLDSGLIDDTPADAIVPRLTRLLQHLAHTDPAGGWAAYLDGDAPRWSRLVLAGQSQGGGMAAFLAQTRAVAGVISFSGGWDERGGGEPADWYARPSATPLARWHATFHVQEPQAEAIALRSRRLGLPPSQVHALREPLRPGGVAHGDGIANPVYQPLWRQMLALQP